MQVRLIFAVLRERQAIPGFRFAPSGLRALPGAPDQPAGAECGNASGTGRAPGRARRPERAQIVVRLKKQPKAAAYDVQTATADPTVESNWSDAGSFTSCRRIELEGFTSGKTCWVRVRGLGSAGPGAWTAPVSVVAL